MNLIDKLKDTIANNKNYGQPEWVKDYMQYDTEENRISSIPEGESIRIPSIRVIEAYTPSTIKELRVGILKFGLDNTHLQSNRDLIFMMEKYRSSNSGWYNIGSVSEEHLPDKVTHISLTAHQPIPSLTIVVFNFQFQKEESKCLNKTLNDNFKTYTTKIGADRHSIHTPYQQKKKEVGRMREYLFSLCTTWISEHFKGLFTSNIINTTHPRLELVFLKRNEPFTKLGLENEYQSYLYALELGTNQEYYTSEYWENMFFKFYNDSDQLKNGIVISGNLDKILENNELKGYGSDISRMEKISFHLRYFEKTFMIISLEIIAKHYFITANNLRDKYGELEINLKNIRDFTELENKMFIFQKDLIPICNELKELEPDHHLFRFEVYPLYSSIEFRSDQDLIELISRNISSYAISTINRVEEIMSLGNNLSQYLYSLSNKKSTEASYTMTGIMIVLTLFIAFLTYILVAKELVIWPF